MTIAVIDIVFFVIMLLAALHGSMKGLISEVLSKAAFVLGIISAVALYDTVAAMIVQNGGNAFLANIAGFFLVFIIVFLILKILEKLLSGLFKGRVLGGLDHALGFFWGAFEGLLIVAVILVILYIQPVFDAGALLQNSVFHHLLQGVLSAPVQYVSHITVASVPDTLNAAPAEKAWLLRIIPVRPGQVLHV